MAQFVSILLSCILIVSAIYGVQAVEYTVTNRAESTPGGMRFNNELGADYTKQTMSSASEFIWRVFQQNTEAERNNVPTVALFVDDMDGIILNSQIILMRPWINLYIYFLSPAIRILLPIWIPLEVNVGILKVKRKY